VAAGLRKEIVREDYSGGALDRLGRLAAHQNRTEASILRQALDELIQKHR
jgi:hypothetical protein